MGANILLLSALLLGVGMVNLMFDTAAAEEKPPVRAWVTVDLLDDGVVSLRPFCVSEQAMVLDYYLLVEKKGSGGSSMNKQTGKVEVSPGLEKGLGTISLKMAMQDRCRVQLKIMAKGRLVADEDFWLGPSGR
jgi:hypothetical protein